MLLGQGSVVLPGPRAGALPPGVPCGYSRALDAVGCARERRQQPHLPMLRPQQSELRGALWAAPPPSRLWPVCEQEGGLHNGPAGRGLRALMDVGEARAGQRLLSLHLPSLLFTLRTLLSAPTCGLGSVL